MNRGRLGVWAWRIGILVAFLGAWEYLTGIKAISKTPGLYWIDPFFISRPSVIAQRFAYLTSDKVRLTIWQMALSTIQSTLWGFLVGITTGFLAGLVLGRYERPARILDPFIVAFNSLPRIALVPLITMIFGFGLLAKIVLAWTFASLTPSISFALIGVVVGEFIGGESGGGLGYLIIQSLGTLNAADMMVALVVLGAIGIVMALGIRQIESRLLRWRPEYQKR